MLLSEEVLFQLKYQIQQRKIFSKRLEVFSMLNDAVGFEKIFIATGYTDLRRGIDSLASTIKFQFDLDPFQKHILYDR